MVMFEPIEVYRTIYYEVYDPNRANAIAWFTEEEDARAYAKRLNTTTPPWEESQHDRD